MPFAARVFWLPKDVGHPEEYQDACAIDPEQGIAAVADGVASAIFSRQWAEILAQATVADPPDVGDDEAFAGWLAERRGSWNEAIDVSGLAWFQKAKLPLGAFSTLVWVRVEPMDDEREGAFGAYRLEGYAIGDSCLFHCRRGELVRMFPMENAAQFEADPVVLGSVDLNRDQLQKFVALDETCYDDDTLVLCSDAIAEWAVRGIEADAPPNWDRYWTMTHAEWEQEIAELRDQRLMRYDDATLVLLRVAAEGAMVEEPEEPAAPPVEAAPSDDESTVPASTQREPAESAPSDENDWKDKFKAAGRNFSEGVEQASSQLFGGLRKWTDKAIEKVRGKLGPEKKEEEE